MTLGAVSMVAQSLYPNRPTAIQVTFNVLRALSRPLWPMLSITIRSAMHSSATSTDFVPDRFSLFHCQRGSIATVISLSEGKPLRSILVDCYFWSFPYYLVGAGIAAAISWFNHAFNWETSLLFVPAIYLIYRSYRLYLGKLEDEKRHVEEMANLHLRTIEALALAIEAKDQTTHDHLQRVRIYAIEVAKELG